VQSYAVVNDGDTLLFQVNTCNEESTEVTVVELENAIIVTARTDRCFSCGGDDCSDPQPVELNGPLGDRLVVDFEDDEILRRDSQPQAPSCVPKQPAQRREYRVRCLGRGVTRPHGRRPDYGAELCSAATILEIGGRHDWWTLLVPFQEVFVA
jgi:hypothetical protein